MPGEKVHIEVHSKALLSYGYLTSLAANFSRAELSVVVVLELARLGPGQRDSRTGPRYV
jgi:hypothetical protein